MGVKKVGEIQQIQKTIRTAPLGPVCWAKLRRRR